MHVGGIVQHILQDGVRTNCLTHITPSHPDWQVKSCLLE